LGKAEATSKQVSKHPQLSDEVENGLPSGQHFVFEIGYEPANEQVSVPVHCKYWQAGLGGSTDVFFWQPNAKNAITKNGSRTRCIIDFIRLLFIFSLNFFFLLVPTKKIYFFKINRCFLNNQRIYTHL
jgi:hypothetical protein